MKHVCSFSTKDQEEETGVEAGNEKNRRSDLRTNIAADS